MDSPRRKRTNDDADENAKTASSLLSVCECEAVKNASLYVAMHGLTREWTVDRRRYILSSFGIAPSRS